MPSVPANCKTIILDAECCNKTRYFVGMSDFPPIGEEKVLYVDESTGNVYIWDNDSDSYLGNSGTGSQGTQGTAGTPGIQGLQGIQGSLGLQGSAGATSAQGAQGGIGVTGAQGTQGIQGPQGILGVTGSQGIQGTQGLQGLQGIQGRQGIQGSQGTQGRQGTQGVQGTNGFSCINYTFQNTESFTVAFILVDCDLLTITNLDLSPGQTYTRCISFYSQINAGNVTITSNGLCSGAQSTQGTQGTQGIQGVQGIQGRQGTQGVQGTSIQGLQGIQGTSASLGCCCYAGLSYIRDTPTALNGYRTAYLYFIPGCDLTGATVNFETSGGYFGAWTSVVSGDGYTVSLYDSDTGFYRVKISKPGCCDTYSAMHYHYDNPDI